MRGGRSDRRAGAVRRRTAPNRPAVRFPSMTHGTARIRPAMSAIAAVLALSPTALIAQAAPEATQPVTRAPVTPAPDSAPAPTAGDPSAATVSEPVAPSAAP